MIQVMIAEIIIVANLRRENYHFEGLFNLNGAMVCKHILFKDTGFKSQVMLDFHEKV
jgi:hypothetical protein